MKILKIDPENPEDGLIALASTAISEGKILIYPTDTVYGIGCSVKSRNIKKIFEIKKRSDKNPLSVAFSSLEMVKRYVFLTSKEENFIRDNILKPYTFVVRKRESIPGIITAGKDTVGVRIPDHRVVKGMIENARIPIITTSANISGEKAPVSFDEIDEDIIAKVDLAIDSGRCKIGKPSLVIDLKSGKFLRGFR
ncbi:MAG: threonylcarbamoyl-AMP synthase [Candidatus Altiarchaeales archaeon ex4484_43]|nr:MAG: threonylcarbamoyl-AMP synthase [Candidatus Altiarchaeales archaeon ex4484_43]